MLGITAIYALAGIKVLKFWISDGLLWEQARVIGFRKMRKRLRHASDNEPLEKNLLLVGSPEKAFSTSQVSASTQFIPSIFSIFRPK